MAELIAESRRAFQQSVHELCRQDDSCWSLWLRPDYADRAELLLAQLQHSRPVPAERVLKQDRHRLVFWLGETRPLAVKWQRYRDPRRLLKANSRRQARLTRNEGGMLRTEWMNNRYLYAAGITVPRPAGFAEKRIGGVIVEQAMICTYLQDAVQMKPLVDDAQDFTARLPWLMSSLSLAERLHAHRLYHFDFHNRNVLFVGEQYYLIDNEKVFQATVPRDDLLAAMLGRMGYCLRAVPDEPAAYWSLAQQRLQISDRVRPVFQAACQGRLSGKKLTSLVHHGG